MVLCQGIASLPVEGELRQITPSLLTLFNFQLCLFIEIIASVLQLPCIALVTTETKGWKTPVTGVKTLFKKSLLRGRVLSTPVN